MRLNKSLSRSRKSVPEIIAVCVVPLDSGLEIAGRTWIEANRQFTHETCPLAAP
jgi:hypothetical protein